MYELSGKYATAIVYAKEDQEDADLMKKQIIGMLDEPMMEDLRVRIMPDCHAGKGCVIGTTMTIKDKVVPNVVGVDIGCGVLTTKLNVKEDEVNFAKLDALINEKIPNGTGHISTSIIQHYPELDNLRCPIVNKKAAEMAIGSLGGGNHFIELGKDHDGYIYLVIHTGSRHLGFEVAKWYQSQGYEDRCAEEKGGSCRDLTNALIADLKSRGEEQRIEAEIKKLRSEYFRFLNVKKDLAYIDGQRFNDYINDMGIIQKMAALNRKTITNTIMTGMGWDSSESFDTIHNYIDLDHMILRKGAVAAYENQKLIIPMNMRDGSLICIGKGNEDWNCSAPHGAGRIVSRREARRRFNVKDYQDAMEGIYTTTANGATLDECPMAYKPMDDILSEVNPTIDIVDTITPIYNFKARD